MQPSITIKRVWSDNDVMYLEFFVCDGNSVFVNSAYAGLVWRSDAARRLKTFSRQVHGGLFNLVAGEIGPEYDGGAFSARFHWYRPTALMISTSQQGEYFDFKGHQVASEAKLFLRTEAGTLDRFCASLPLLDREDGTEVTLECLSATG